MIKVFDFDVEDGEYDRRTSTILLEGEMKVIEGAALWRTRTKVCGTPAKGCLSWSKIAGDNAQSAHCHRTTQTEGKEIDECD